MDYFAMIDHILETKKLKKLLMGMNARKICYANMI